MWPIVKTLYQACAKLLSYWLGNRSIEILELSENRLVLLSGFTRVIVDKRRGEVAVGKRVKVKFSSIQSIDVVHRKANSDRPERWAVRLHVNWHSSPVVGEASDSTDASIAAARIATFTAKPVRAL